MNRVRLTTARRRRVYTKRTAWLLALGLLLASPGGAQTPADLTIAPTMVKGPSAAKVTIVEFSDYQ